jgi:hypothetical protein
MTIVTALAVVGAAVDCGASGSQGFSATPDGSTSPDSHLTPSDAGRDSANDALILMMGNDAGHDATAVIPGTDSGADSAVHDASVSTGQDATVPDAGVTDSGGLTDAILHHNDGPIQVPVVYGHSDTTLYKLDTDTSDLTKVGDFIGCDDTVIDLALDKDSKMYATTFSGVFTVNTSTAVCSLLSLGTYPNSLSFVPAGTVDPNVEALVGYNGSTYVRIDTTSGAVSNIGSIGGGYTSSGDIVSAIGGGTYLTVKGGPESCSDCLVQVDPTNGALVTDFGPVQHTDVFGLAFWAGNVYGFDATGHLFEITFPTATTISVMSIPIPNAPSGLQFYGAGSTTAAPIR